jgi:chemotaxis protein CheD
MAKREEIMVWMGEYKVLAGDGVLKTVGLGSCVGVALYDSAAKVGALAHILLPRATDARRRVQKKPGTYADVAIPNLLEEMERLGASPTRIWAKIAGGGEMFATTTNSPLNVGPLNVSSVKEILNKANIPLLGEETGGSRGRSMRLDITSGVVYVLRVGDEGEMEI